MKDNSENHEINNLVRCGFQCEVEDLAREREREELFSGKFFADGDFLRFGGERHRGAGGVQRRHRQHRRRRPPHPRETSGGDRLQALLLSGSLHLSHTPIRRHHLRLYGQRHFRKENPFLVLGRYPNEVYEELW